ncbi:hypothetical protein ONZ45_g11047 [Pleurotus djamor]|nr:hypothetical protein ONZ45_g11047 [Pleurotus djamor]
MRPQAAFDHKANQQIPSLDDWPIWRVPVESMEIEVIACIFNTLACDTELKIRSLFCTPTCPGNVFFEARGIEDALAAVKDVPHTWVDAKSNSSLYICLSARSTDCLRYLKYGANENSMALPGRLVRVRPESRPPNSLAYISSSRNAGAIIELELLPSSFEDGAAVGIENAPIEVGIDEVQLTHVIPTADEIPLTSQNLLNAEKARFLHRIRLLRGERVIVIEGPQRGLTGTVFDITGTTIGLVRTYPVAEVHSAVPEGGIVYTQIWTIQRHFQAQDPVDIAETELNSRSVATATFIEYANGDRVKLQQSSKANGAQHFEEFVELDDRIRHHIPHEPPPPILPCMGTGDPYRHMEVAIVDHPVLKGRQGRIVGSHLSISNHWVYEVNIGQEMTPWRSQLEAKYMRELHSGLHIQKAVRLPHEVLLPLKPVEPLQPNDHAKIPHQAIEDNNSVQRAEPALVPVVASTPLPPLIPQYIEADEASGERHVGPEV